MKKGLRLLSFSQKGQSLVELALLMPILLILVAGTVEVSNLLITKNRIETAARAAVRFASDGGEDVHIVALNSVTQTLDLSEGVWDIFTIHGRINDAGDDFDSSTWEVEHYGLGQTEIYTDVLGRLSDSCTTDCLQDEMIDELRGNREGNQSANLAADLEVVGVYVIHDIDSILGLNALPNLVGLTSIQGFGVMRRASLSKVDPTNGCTAAFPMAISNGVRSITEADYEVARPNMAYPTLKPTYASFIHHRPNMDLGSATEGTIFLYDLDLSQLVWLKWNAGINGGDTTLSNSLAWPGNVADYSQHVGDGGVATPPYLFVVRGFAEVGDVTDKSLHIGDRIGENVQAGTDITGVTTVLQLHIDRLRTLRMPIMSNMNPQFIGGVPYFQADSFAIFRIRGYSLTSNWVLLEFVRVDESCGN